MDRQTTPYTLTVVVPIKAGDPHGHRALRGALKRLLRSHGVRCTRAEPTQPSDGLAVEGDTGGECQLLAAIPIDT